MNVKTLFESCNRQVTHKFFKFSIINAVFEVLKNRSLIAELVEVLRFSAKNIEYPKS